MSGLLSAWITALGAVLQRKSFAGAARPLMDWIAGMGRRAAGGAEGTNAVQKLRGYRDLAKARLLGPRT